MHIKLSSVIQVLALCDFYAFFLIQACKFGVDFILCFACQDNGLSDSFAFVSLCLYFKVSQ